LSASELRPCPFCGVPPSYWETSRDGGLEAVRIACTSLACVVRPSISAATYDDGGLCDEVPDVRATLAWNTRPPAFLDEPASEPTV